MKHHSFLQFSSAIFFILMIALIYQQPLNGQNKIRIGTYDSRAIILAYLYSDHGKEVMQTMQGMNEKIHKAIQDKDSAIIKKLNFEGPTRQAILHEQGFGSGSVRYEIMAIKDKIDSLAKAEKIDIILSKWELNYSKPGCDIIDLTDKITVLFKPNDKLNNMLKELLKSEPIKEAYLIQD